jgi:hypothetical protein
MEINIITVLGFHNSKCQVVTREYDDEIQITVLNSSHEEIRYVGKAHHLTDWCSLNEIYFFTHYIDLSKHGEFYLLESISLRDSLIKFKKLINKPINCITRENMEDLGFSCYFDDLFNAEYDISYEEPIRGSTNVVRFVYRLDKEVQGTGIPEEFQDTLWETNEFHHSDIEGFDSDRITSLHRVERKTMEVTKVYYEQVEES